MNVKVVTISGFAKYSKAKPYCSCFIVFYYNIVCYRHNDIILIDNVVVFFIMVNYKTNNQLLKPNLSCTLNNFQQHIYFEKKSRQQET